MRNFGGVVYMRKVRVGDSIYILKVGDKIIDVSLKPKRGYQKTRLSVELIKELFPVGVEYIGYFDKKRDLWMNISEMFGDDVIIHWCGAGDYVLRTGDVCHVSEWYTLLLNDFLYYTDYKIPCLFDGVEGYVKFLRDKGYLKDDDAKETLDFYRSLLNDRSKNIFEKTKDFIDFIDDRRDAILPYVINPHRNKFLSSMILDTFI